MSFPFTVKFRLISREGQGLKKVPNILATELRGAMGTIGKRLKESASIRMRKDTGEEIKSLIIQVQGQGLNLSVVIYSQLIKAFTDAYGMRPGVRVPYGFGSRLNTWAQRRVRIGESRPLRGETHAPYTGAGPNRIFRSRAQKAQRSSVIPRGSRVTNSGARVSGSNRIRSKNRAASRLAYLTARAIFDRGLRGSHWNREALIANKTRIVRELKNAMSRAVAKINRG